MSFLRRASGCSDGPFLGLLRTTEENAGARYETDCDSTGAQRDLELLMYEIAATTGDDEIALGKALDMLICRKHEQKDIERAVEIIERYFTSEATKTSSSRIIASLYKPFQNEGWVQNIKGRYKDLMRETSFNPTVVISYAGFYTAIYSYRKGVSSEDGVRALTRAIVHSACSANILETFELTKSLEILIAGDDEEQFALACAMYSNIIEHVTMMLKNDERIVALVDKDPLRRNFMCLAGC